MKRPNQCQTPPFSTPSGFEEAILPVSTEGALWALIQGDKILLKDTSLTLPFSSDDVPLQRSLYMGTFEEHPLFTGEVADGVQVPKGWSLHPLRLLHGLLSDAQLAIAGRALQLLNWDKIHRYCGLCASPTKPKENERCRVCLSCGHLFYPKISPVIMALVKKGKKVLLARSAHFPGKFYSVLAGFVGPGETLEQCLEREVKEEVGIRVKNIRYFGSQSWPFSHSLLMGFSCEWGGGEIQIDPTEIESAGWFDLSSLPELPTHLSLARYLIDAER